jgi:hypothetical protein
MASVGGSLPDVGRGPGRLHGGDDRLVVFTVQRASNSRGKTTGARPSRGQLHSVPRGGCHRPSFVPDQIIRVLCENQRRCDPWGTGGAKELAMSVFRDAPPTGASTSAGPGIPRSIHVTACDIAYLGLGSYEDDVAGKVRADIVQSITLPHLSGVGTCADKG